MENRTETIDLYLLDKLNENDRIAFEKEMETNKKLQAEVELTRKAMNVIKMGALKSKLDEIQNKQFNSNIITLKSSNMKKLYYAIAACLVLVAGTFYFYFNSEGKSDKLFAQYFKADEGLPTLMGGSEDYTFDDAMVDYKNKEYKKAADKFADILRKHKATDTLHYYYGLSLIGSRQYLLATDQFESIKSDSPFFEKSQWYLALALIKHDDIKQAKKLLIEIKERKNGPYVDQANELMAALE